MSLFSSRAFPGPLSCLVSAAAVALGLGLLRRKRARHASLRLVIAQLRDSGLGTGARRTAVDLLRNRFGWAGIMTAVYLMSSSSSSTNRDPGAAYWVLMRALRAEARAGSAADIPAASMAQLVEFIRRAPEPSSRREGILLKEVQRSLEEVSLLGQPARPGVGDLRGKNSNDSAAVCAGADLGTGKSRGTPGDGSAVAGAPARVCTADTSKPAEFPRPWMEEWRSIRLGGHAFRIHQCPTDRARSERTELGQAERTGCVLWNSAVVLAEHTRTLVQAASEPPVVLELGAGLGLPAIVATAAGARLVIATDLPGVLPLLRENIETGLAGLVTRGHSPLEARCLAWGDQDAVQQLGITPDIVLCADVAYFREVHDKLVDTLKHVVRLNPDVTVVMCNKIRNSRVEMRLFEELLPRAGFSVENVALPSLDARGVLGYEDPWAFNGILLHHARAIRRTDQ